MPHPRAGAGVGRWNGQSWSTFGSLNSGGGVSSLVVHDDGSGPAFHAGGSFTSVAGVPASGIARWDGNSWTPVGSGICCSSEGVFAPVVFDDGSGPRLHAGGSFTSIGGVAANHVASWDGSVWAPLGSGLGTSGNAVFALEVIDDGVNYELFAGGSFSLGTGMPVTSVAHWDGTSWSSLGAGVGGLGSSRSVYTLRAFDDGSGAALYVGGSFKLADGLSTRNLARWSSQGWSLLGHGLSSVVWDAEYFDDGGGSHLYAAGDFPGGIVRFDGTGWSSVGSGANGPVHALAVHDDGTGPALYAGGEFTSIGGVPATIARWDGASWSAVQPALSSVIVRDLVVHDDGSGPALYAAGLNWLQAVAKWNGSSWDAVGSGLNGLFTDIRSLAVFDDGSGPRLYAGGSITQFPSGLAVWDGAGWTSLPARAPVTAMTVFDDGSGPALFIGNSDARSGLPSLSRWDGSSLLDLSWSADYGVTALGTYDDGDGPALYVSGEFDQIGGVAASRIVRWDGASFRALGSGLSGPARAFLADPGALGPGLIVGGDFAGVPDSGDSFVARWGRGLPSDIRTRMR